MVSYKEIQKYERDQKRIFREVQETINNKYGISGYVIEIRSVTNTTTINPYIMRSDNGINVLFQEILGDKKQYFLTYGEVSRNCLKKFELEM